MPRKRRRVSAFFKILVVLTLVCGGLTAGGYYIMRSAQSIELTPPPDPEGCAIDSGEGSDRVHVEQAGNAATVSGVAFSKDLPDQAVVIAYATVWQESKFKNIAFGDRDSVGLFQQRPSQEWGEAEQLLDPVFASAAFYDALVEVEDYQSRPVYEAAQAVQRSADGFAYDQHKQRSREMMLAFTGQNGAAVHCWSPAEDAEPADIAAAEAEMARVFGVEPGSLPVADGPQTGDLGWAMALWAMSNAPEYGVSSVNYSGLTWTAAKGRKGWTESQSSTEGRVVLK